MASGDGDASRRFQVLVWVRFGAIMLGLMQEQDG
jgi:hypothetical protein